MTIMLQVSASQLRLRNIPFGSNSTPAVPIAVS